MISGLVVLKFFLKQTSKFMKYNIQHVKNRIKFLEQDSGIKFLDSSSMAML